MSSNGLKCYLFVIFLFLTIQGCRGAIDCAMAHFDGASTDSFKVYCADGFHECGAQGQGCCADVSIYPLELTLVVLGPTAALISCLFTIFVLKSVISQALSDGHSGKMQIDPHLVQ